MRSPNAAIFRIAPVAIFVVVVVLITLAAFLTALGHNSVDEEKIKQSVPPGSSVQQIVAFLDSEGIEHDGTVDRAGDYSRLDSTGVPPSTTVLVAIIRNTGGFFLVGEDTQIFFILDDDQRLVDYIFQKGYTGP